MTLNEALGAEIRAEAAARRMTIRELAQKSGTTRSSLYLYLDAERDLPVGRLASIAAVLGVRASVLVSRAEQRQRSA